MTDTMRPDTTKTEPTRTNTTKADAVMADGRRPVSGRHRKPEQPSRLVLHLGGPRHGQLARVLVTELAGWLVYAGPRWFGVYRRATPTVQRVTEQGSAQVWVHTE